MWNLFSELGDFLFVYFVSILLSRCDVWKTKNRLTEPRLVSIIFLSANICMCVRSLCNRRHHSTAVWGGYTGLSFKWQSTNHKMQMSCTMHVHTSSKGPEWRRHPHMSSLPSLCEPCSLPKRQASLQGVSARSGQNFSVTQAGFYF